MSTLIQNTQAWEEMRKDKIGASDAPIIMGVSPWKTPYQLWQEKLNIISKEEMNYAMKRGHDLEDKARKELERMTGIWFEPQVKFHPRFPWMMASLDAIDVENSVIAEIKCAGFEDHCLALQGIIPEKYYPQLQHQLEVCGLEMGYYFSFDGEKGVLIKIFRDNDYVKELLRKEKEFYECMKQLTPPALTNRDYVKKEEPEWQEDASEWYLLCQQIELLEAKREKVRNSLIFQCEGQSSLGWGLKVAKCTKKGSIDYSKIDILKEMDLEVYRKPSVEFWKITKE